MTWWRQGISNGLLVLVLDGSEHISRELAVERFEASIDPNPAMESWNPYVEATIAFLEGDEQALLAARDAMAATSDGMMNMPVVDRLIENLGESYMDALRPPSQQ
jgi:hypothetical protein